jgi:hypothetical protein
LVEYNHVAAQKDASRKLRAPAEAGKQTKNEKVELHCTKDCLDAKYCKDKQQL